MDINFWNDKRPQGVANSIDPDSFPNVLALINELLTANGERLCLQGLVIH